MERLWAPWRLEYIQSGGEDECIFCLEEDNAEDERRLVLLRGSFAYVIMNRYPYSNGHLMVAPYRHLAKHGELSDNEVRDLHRLMVCCEEVLSDCCGAEGFNVGWNIGKAAGAGIAGHLHLHVVPRWQGDTNFMPIFADARVIPQHLEATYRLLKPAFDERCEDF